MPITFSETEAVFAGECRVDEADALYEWLQKQPEGKVRLGQCDHFHAALFQVLLAVKARIVEPPANPLLAKWIVGMAGKTESPWVESAKPCLVVTPDDSPVLPQVAPRTRRKPVISASDDLEDKSVSSPTPQTRSRRGTTGATRKPFSSKDDAP